MRILYRGYYKKIHLFSLRKNAQMQDQPALGPRLRGCSQQPLWARGPSSRVVAADESPELLGHSVNQFLLVSLIFPKLCKHVVLAAGVLHPKQRGEEREQSVRGGNGGHYVLTTTRSWESPEHFHCQAHTHLLFRKLPCWHLHPSQLQSPLANS